MTPSFQNYTQEQIQEKFRLCLRDADAYIKERKFELARKRLIDARSLDPTNPYIAAFEERIRLFEENTDQLRNFFPKPVPTVLISSENISPAMQQPGVEVSVSAELLEERLRHQIDSEYKARYTQKLQEAELQTTKILEEERKKFDHLRRTLEEQHEEQILQVEKHLEGEYNKRLAEELASTEERLKNQFRVEQSLVEQQMKANLTQHYEAELRQMQESLQRDQFELLEKERQSFQERERMMKEQFEQQIQQSLLEGGVEVSKKQGTQQRLDQQKLRQQLEAEFQAGVLKVRESFKKHYDGLKSRVEQTFFSEQGRLKEKYTQETKEQLELLRKHETQDFERKRTNALRDLELKLHSEYQSDIIAQRKRIQADAEAEIEAVKKRLEEENQRQIIEQNKKIQQLRSEIRAEMERTFIQRLEQMSKQYDKKMELLGIRNPETEAEAVELYRNKMRECYAGGQPSIEEARKLMELKEILGVTFDNHFAMESDVRLELYVERAEKMIAAGELTKKDVGVLDKMQQQFCVNAEQAVKVEPYLLSCFQQFASKGRILLVDDDTVLLKVVQEDLSSRGFEVFAFEHTDEAFEKLKQTGVDIILSDIKFPEGEREGFRFFEMVQEYPHLRKLPFIFMSALNDGVIVRSGVQLGVDDYLTKPVDVDLLVAILEGKLRRYRAVEKN